jgi:hypothetical protein
MTAEGARLDTGREFWHAADGRWAGERLLEALQRGEPLTTAALRTNATLRKDEWVAFDEALVEEAVIRLRGVADLRAAGLVIPVRNGIGKTIFEYEKVSDMSEAEISLDGMTMGEDDRQEFTLDALPMPILHKGFSLSLRTLAASRERGESLDTTQARTAGRLVSELAEKLLFRGTTKKFRGLPIYGYTTHPDRNVVNYEGTGGVWSNAAKTGEQILKDALTLKAALEADRMYGPYWLYVPSDASTKLEEDFKANSDLTIRQRLLQIDGLQRVQVVDQLPSGNVVMCQATRDVTCLVEGEPLQTIQWDIQGGMGIKFKAFAIWIPLIRSDAQGRSGVAHMVA